MMADALSAFVALIFILGLLILAAWAVRYFGLLPGQPKVKGATKQIEITESRMVDGRNRLLVVKWKNKEFLLASNPNGIRLLSDPDTAKKGRFEQMVDENAQED